MIAPKESQLEASLTLKAGLNPRPQKQQKHTINHFFRHSINTATVKKFGHAYHFKDL